VGAEDCEHKEDRQDDDEAVQADAEDAQQMETLALEEEGEAEGVGVEELQQAWKEAQELHERRER